MNASVTNSSHIAKILTLKYDGMMEKFHMSADDGK